MPAPPPIRLENFKGIDNKSYDARMPDGFLREAVDCFIANDGAVHKRGGYTLIDTGYFSSIGGDEYRCFAVKDGDLIELFFDINGSFTSSVIRAGVTDAQISFCALNNNYYYSSTAVTGVITPTGHKTFGMAQVNVQPTLAAATGTMQPGRYLVAVTFLDADGVESGTKEPAVITLAASKQIALSNILVSSNPRVTHKAIYCSTADGEELYRQSVITNATTTANITSVNTHNLPLTKSAIYPAPSGGHLVAYHYGHIYIAVGNKVFYSLERPKYEQFNPFHYYQFNGKITAIMPLESGIWISAENDGLYFISGDTPRKNLQVMGNLRAFKKHHTVIKKGSNVKVPAEFIGSGAPSSGWMATSNDGVWLLMDNGSFAQKTPQINIPVHRGCVAAIFEDTNSYKYGVIMNDYQMPLRAL